MTRKLKYVKNESEWIGQRFGSAVVTKLVRTRVYSYTGRKNYTQRFDILQLMCDCGRFYESNARGLLEGRHHSCGCQNWQDLTGKKFGRGTVICRHDMQWFGNKKLRRIPVWTVLCDCGNTYYSNSEVLKKNAASSCGCGNKKFCSQFKPTTESIIWRHMKYNGKKHKHREVLVEREYVFSLLKTQNYKCALSGLPISIEEGSASLDRINNDIPYTKDNIQWVHRTINFMKGSLEQQSFIDFCGSVCRFKSPA